MPLLNKAGLFTSNRYCHFYRRGVIVKIPMLVTLLVVAMLAGLAFIFLVL